MQNSLMFWVKGDGADYEVRFERDGQNLTASCSCEPVQSSKICDHRFALLEEDGKNLANGETSKIVMLREWLKGSDIEAAMIALGKAKGELALAQEKVDYCREMLLKRMLD